MDSVRRFRRTLACLALLMLALVPLRKSPRLLAQTAAPPFEILDHRMDIDVDGAPNAYGPPGRPALDNPHDAHYRGHPWAPIVGYLTEGNHSKTPVVQGPTDPFPGYYVSQTAFSDPHCTNPRNPRCYVDATRIDYVVLGKAATRRGARLGDFVAVYSRRTHKSTFAIVGDDGNPSGNEGSLHLLQDLGYPFHDGIHDAVEGPEIIVRYYPHSNPNHLFFQNQRALGIAAGKLGLSRDFSESELATSRL